MVCVRQVGAPSTISLLRRGARSVVVTYSVEFSATFGKLSGGMTAELEERPLDPGKARFTVRNIGTRQGSAPLLPWESGKERTWEGEFLSAQNIFEIKESSAPVGTALSVGSDPFTESDVKLPFEAALPLDGTLTVLGLVGQRITIRGQMSYLLLGAKRKCAVEGQFDPYSGRPVRIHLETLSTGSSLDPQVQLTIKATGVA